MSIPKINPKYLEEVSKRAPGQPGSGIWCQYISQEMEKVSNIKENLDTLNTQKLQAENYYNTQLKQIYSKVSDLQDACIHPNLTRHQGVYEMPSYSTCDICGKEFK